MLARRVSMFVYVFAVFSGSIVSADDAKTAKPKIIISKATTHITSPLTKDGQVDYAGALNEFYGKGVTPQNNAVVLFYKLFGAKPDGIDRPDEFFRLLGMPKPKPSGNHYINLGVYLDDTLKVDLSSKRYGRVLDDQGLAMDGPWKSSDFPEIAGWLEMNKKPLTRLQEATRCPRYFLPIVWKDGEEREFYGLTDLQLPNVQRMRSFARALSARAMLHLGEGRQEAAWQDLMACHRLGRLVSQGPMLIEPLVGFAISSVARGGTLVFLEHTQPTSKQNAAYLRDLDTLAPLPDMAEVIDRVERYNYLDFTIMAANSSEKDLSGGFEQFDEGLGRLLSGVPSNGVDWNVTLRTGNAWYDRLVVAMKKPTHFDRKVALDKLDAEWKALSKNTKDTAKRFAAARTKPQEMGRLVGNMMAAFSFRSSPRYNRPRIALYRSTPTSALLSRSLATRLTMGSTPSLSINWLQGI